jgi:hypothetical protein
MSSGSDSGLRRACTRKIPAAPWTIRSALVVGTSMTIAGAGASLAKVIVI